MHSADGTEFWPWLLDDPEPVDVEMTEEVKVKLEEASLKIPSKAKLAQETCQHMFSSLKSGGQYQVCKISVPWKYVLEEEMNKCQSVDLFTAFFWS